MRTLLVLVLAAVFAPMALAKVWTTVYRCDEVTPLGVVDPNHPTVYNDIMVGTRLVVFISSDTGGLWLGSLMVLGDDKDYGMLSGRGYNQQRRTYDGSCLDAAGGKTAFAQSRKRSVGVGFDFNSHSTAVPGDWFVFDYRAERTGLCHVGLYDGVLGFGAPLEILSFSHVPSRDFDGNTVVGFQDFALLASQWGSAADSDPNSPDAAFDLNSDSRIDVGDLALFSEYWLERTDWEKPVADPNNSPAGNP